MKRQIVLDTETTGLLTVEKHRLVEIAAMVMKNRRFTGEYFHYYLNPQRGVDKGAFEVHGLSSEFLRDKPLFSAVAEEFLAFIDGAELIIHNAPFDMGFLNYELQLLDRNAALLERRCAVVDTLVMARKKHPGQSNSLDALCRRYQVDNSARDLHGALIDARLLGQVYLAMTGGQDQLFAVDDSVERLNIACAAMSTAKTAVQRSPLPVIQPNAEELQNHQQMLAMLEKNGRCLWDVK